MKLLHLNYSPLFQQITRFIVIGTLAALVNMGIVWLLVERLALLPLQANPLAFCLAFAVSYSGHKYFTFRHTTHTDGNLWRFLLVAIASLALNEILFFAFLRLLPHDYLLALFFTLLIVPCFTFILSKHFAFVAA